VRAATPGRSRTATRVAVPTVPQAVAAIVLAITEGPGEPVTLAVAGATVATALIGWTIVERARAGAGDQRASGMGSGTAHAAGPETNRRAIWGESEEDGDRE
jgi:hypothetical protein